MKRKAPVIGIALLASAMAVVTLMNRRVTTGEATGTSGNSRTATAHFSADALEEGGHVKTKAKARGQGQANATHSPQRLREFILPEVVIDGLGLEEALRKLYSAYQDACLKSGENPLVLTFTVPAGNARKLQVKLLRNNFNSSVHLLASLSGMKASRHGVEYRFEPTANEQRPAKQALKVGPDLGSKLQELAGLDPENKMPLSDVLAALGLALDPSTRVSLMASGLLEIDSASTADVSAITALVKSISEQPRLQHKFTAHLCELEPESLAVIPHLTTMTEAERTLLLRDLMQKKGAAVSTFPTVTTKSGQEATIEIGGQLIAPKDGVDGTFETHQTGHVVKIHGDTLGFGHDLSVQYTDTTGEIDSETMKPVITRRTDISDAGFSGDHNTRISIQTRPDGSKTLFLITSEMIDTTGMAIRPTD